MRIGRGFAVKYCESNGAALPHDRDFLNVSEKWFPVLLGAEVLLGTVRVEVQPGAACSPSARLLWSRPFIHANDGTNLVHHLREEHVTYVRAACPPVLCFESKTRGEAFERSPLAVVYSYIALVPVRPGAWFIWTSTRANSVLSRAMSEEEADVTALLVRLSNGEAAALDRLLPTVYEELRRVARNQLRDEREDHTLRTTELVHEAYEKLVSHSAVDWQDRQHFFAVAARAMRQVLVDHARKKTAEKRGGGASEVPLEQVTLPRETKTETLIALDDALDRLAEQDERAAKVVECRFFGGYTIKETADVLDVSRSTVKRDWRGAQAWLNQALQDS